MFLSAYARAASGKSKYVVVQLASVISGTTAAWVRLREAPESAAILYDPAIGQKVLFKEKLRIKGINTLEDSAKEKYGIRMEVERLETSPSVVRQ